MSNKRKSEAISTCGAHNFVPKSISSYLCGALNTDFASTRELIRRENSFIDEGHNEPEEFLDQVIEEVFRYLFLITDCAENHEIQLSPSLCVDKVFHSLLLDPVLYHRICDTILNLRGITSDMRPIRVLPHNPLGSNLVSFEAVINFVVFRWQQYSCKRYTLSEHFGSVCIEVQRCSTGAHLAAEFVPHKSSWNKQW